MISDGRSNRVTTGVRCVKTTILRRRHCQISLIWMSINSFLCYVLARFDRCMCLLNTSTSRLSTLLEEKKKKNLSQWDYLLPNQQDGFDRFFFLSSSFQKPNDDWSTKDDRCTGEKSSVALTKEKLSQSILSLIAFRALEKSMLLTHRLWRFFYSVSFNASIHQSISSRRVCAALSLSFRCCLPLF